MNARLRYEWLEAVLDGNIARETGDTGAAASADARRDAIQDDFFRRNRRLAMAAAKSFLRHARGEDVFDHEQAALLGLWEAFAGTDPVKGRAVTFAEDGRLVAEAGWDPAKATFGTFCRSYVQGKVKRSVAQIESGLSYALWGYRPEVMSARDKLVARGVPNPSVREVAAECGLPYETVSAIFTPTATSLQTPIGSDGATLGDLIADQADTSAGLDAEASAPLLRALAPQMKATDLFSFVLREGLIGRPPLSVVDTAARLGLGRGAVASGEGRASKHLRTSVTSGAFLLAMLGTAHRHGTLALDILTSRMRWQTPEQNAAALTAAVAKVEARAVAVPA